MGIVNYPPEKILRPSKINKPDYDHIILWMLKNNDICKWVDFHQEIPTGTLSRHLEKLKRKGLVKNFTRGCYRITSEGKKKFNELSTMGKKGRKINYPPKVILRSGRNYSHWILWMIYNNNYCKRSDFLSDPISINQSSLAKNLGVLSEKGFIIKEDGKYIITQAGKSEYSRILQNYDLDRQTILEEEGKRIEELTKKTMKFFEKSNITDENIHFRFLNNVLRLDYEKVKPILKDEEIFHKILLFLSINHPNNYPNYISSENFSKTYQIKKITLDFFIEEISEAKIYPIRFFKLRKPPDEQYFFQSDGTIEKILRTITENEITKVSYLNRLYSESSTTMPKIDMKSIIKNITGKCCESLFNKDLSSSLKEIIPEYVKFLAYKIESKRKLKATDDKLEGVIWQNLTEVFQSQTSEDLGTQYEEQIKEIENKIEKDPENLDFYYLKVRILIYFNQYREAINLLDNMLEMFHESEKDIKILKAAVLRRMQDIEAGLEIINNLIQKFPKDNDLICYKAYWMQYLDNKQESLEIIQNLVNNEPENGLYNDTFGEILMYFEEYREAAKKFLRAIMIGSDEWYIPQTYIKLGICYKAIKSFDLALTNLKKGKELIKKSTSDPETKEKWDSISDLFITELTQLKT
ncbi:MAG: hypothetical protein ACFFA3_18855 [Promethearchaeota archaeon]